METAEYNILAIDTSSSYLRLAVAFGGDRLVQSNEDIDTSHGRVMLKKIGDLFQSAGMERTDLEAIVVCTGPGSFTGLRIGLAVAKGMAVGLGIPIVGASLFDLAAWHIRDRRDEARVAVPFKKDSCFMATVTPAGLKAGTLRQVPYDELAQAAEKESIIALGGAFGTSSAPLSEETGIKLLEVRASDLIEVGRQMLIRGEIPDLDRLEPLYMQKSQAEIRFEQRRDNP